MACWLKQNPYKAVFTILLLSFAHIARASEPVQLDPNSSSQAPLTILRAVVVEQKTDRFCSIQLFPNGVLVIVRPCALEHRVGHTQRWFREAGSIVFLDADDTRLFRFEQVSEHRFGTADAIPPQMNLSLLPAATTAPMNE